MSFTKNLKLGFVLFFILAYVALWVYFSRSPIEHPPDTPWGMLISFLVHLPVWIIQFMQSWLIVPITVTVVMVSWVLLFQTNTPLSKCKGAQCCFGAVIFLLAWGVASYALSFRVLKLPFMELLAWGVQLTLVNAMRLFPLFLLSVFFLTALRFCSFFTGKLAAAILFSLIVLALSIPFRLLITFLAVTHPFQLVGLITVSVLFSFRAIGKTLYKVSSGILLFLGVLPIMVFLNTLTLVYGPGDCRRIKQEPGVTFFLDYCNSSWAEETVKRTGMKRTQLILMMYNQSIFLSSDNKLIFAGTGDDGKITTMLFAIDRSSLKIVKIFKMRSVWRGVCLKGKCVMVVPADKKIYLLDEKSLKFTRTFTLPFRPRFVIPDPASKQVVIPGEIGQSLAILRLQNSTLRMHLFHKSFTGRSRGALVTGAVYNPTTKLLHMFSEYSQSVPCVYSAKISIWRVSPPAPTYCSSLSEKVRHTGLIRGIAMDPKKREIYLSFPFAGKIYVLDEATKKINRKIKLKMGIREIVFDSVRRLLYVENYFTGELYIVSPSTGKIQQTIFVGRRTRQISYEPGIDRLLVASANGFMEVKLDNKTSGHLNQPQDR